MKVIHVIPGINSEAAGPSYSVPAQCKALYDLGVNLELYMRLRGEGLIFEYPAHSFPSFTIPFSSLKHSPQLLKALKKVCKTADIIHNNSLWLLPNIYPGWAISGTKCKLVTQPRGTLAGWAMNHSKWKKKIIWWLWQKKVVDRSDLFVATCEKEYHEIRALGYKQPVAIVPIGMDIPKGNASVDKRDPNRLRRIVFFGRIHRVKAVDNLVRAWGALHESLPQWELVIAGPDCGAKPELEAIIAEGNIPRVRFTGELNGPAKYDFLTDADIYVLPSHTENFGVTAAEALASGTPTIASQGTPWEGVETNNCGKWVPIGVEPLVTALQELTALSDEERIVMGQNGIDWIRRDFSWEGIGAKMKAAYAWLLGQGEKPDCVRVD